MNTMIRPAFGRSVGLLLLACAMAVGCVSTPERHYCNAALDAIDQVEANLPQLTELGELVAQRHLDGGVIGFPWNYHTLQQELMGRSGGMVNVGFSRPWKADRSDEEKANDVAIISWDRPVAGKDHDRDRTRLEALRKAGTYIIGFGAKNDPSIADLVALCDAFVDTGYGAVDHSVVLRDGTTAGKMNPLVSALSGWAFTAELVAALTRHGKMPTMWMSYALPEGRAWGDKYLRKQQFHDEYTVPAYEPGVLSRRYLARMRKLVKRFRDRELDEIDEAADLIAAERRAGHPVICATMGHMPWTLVGKDRDGEWVKKFDLHEGIDQQIETYNKDAPADCVVVHLAYYGQHEQLTGIFRAKNQRQILITADHPDPAWQPPDEDVLIEINMGYAFGDAAIAIDGYPLKLFPPSGIMQLVAWESLNVAVLDRLATPVEQTESGVCQTCGQQ